MNVNEGTASSGNLMDLETIEGFDDFDGELVISIVQEDAAEAIKTPVSGQVEEIMVDKEPETPLQKPVVDYKKMTLRKYLDELVTPIVLDAMRALSKERPPEPIDFIAAYLLNNKSKYQK